jgi:hypothetical protein
MEGLLRLLPVSSGLQPGPDTASWPLHNYEAHRPYRYSYTWAMLNAHAGVTNNYGHIAASDYRAGSRPLVVIGDSFIESLMNDHGDTLQGILGQRLGPSRPVYGLGASALSASDYLILAGQANAEFSPAAAAFLISDWGHLRKPIRAAGRLLPPSRRLVLRPDIRSAHARSNHAMGASVPR